MKISYISGLFVLSFIFACSPVSGPCEYHYIEILAEVTDIKPYDKDEYTKDELKEGKQLYHVVMNFSGSSLADEPQYLEKIKNMEIDSTLIARKKIRTGYKYRGMVSEIKSGNCTPLFVTFDHDLSGE